jgi:hypothetical protein
MLTYCSGIRSVYQMIGEVQNLFRVIVVKSYSGYGWTLLIGDDQNRFFRDMLYLDIDGMTPPCVLPWEGSTLLLRDFGHLTLLAISDKEDLRAFYHHCSPRRYILHLH